MNEFKRLGSAAALLIQKVVYATLTRNLSARPSTPLTGSNMISMSYRGQSRVVKICINTGDKFGVLFSYYKDRQLN